MTREDDLTKEEAAAWKFAKLATSSTVSELPKFSGWLMTVLGGALTVFVTNHETVSKLIDASHLRIALLLFTCSMFFGFAAQMLAIPVKASLAFSKKARKLETDPDFDHQAFGEHFTSLLILPYRLLISRIRPPKKRDALTQIRSPARLSQILAILVMLQYLYAVSVVLTLALGVEIPGS